MDAERIAWDILLPSPSRPFPFLLCLPPFPSPHPLSPSPHPQECVCSFPVLSCFSCLAAVVCACSALRCLLFCLPGFGFPCVCFLPLPPPFPFFVLLACCVLPLPVFCLCCFLSRFPVVLLWLAVLVPSLLPSPRLCVRVCVCPELRHFTSQSIWSFKFFWDYWPVLMQIYPHTHRLKFDIEKLLKAFHRPSLLSDLLRFVAIYYIMPRQGPVYVSTVHSWNAGGVGSYFQARANEDLGSRTWKRTCKLGVPGHECAAGSLYKSVDDAVVSSYHRGPHPRRFNFEPHQSGFNLRTSQNCDPSFAILLVSFMR